MGIEHLHAQQLVAQAPVEALHKAVLPRRARRDVQGLDTGALQLTANRFRYELWTIVAANVLRHAANHHQVGQHIDHIRRVQLAADFQRQAFTRELIDDRQDLDAAPVRRASEDKVPRPHVVLMLRLAALAIALVIAQGALFPQFLGHFQALRDP